MVQRHQAVWSVACLFDLRRLGSLLIVHLFLYLGGSGVFTLTFRRGGLSGSGGCLGTPFPPATVVLKGRAQQWGLDRGPSLRVARYSPRIQIYCCAGSVGFVSKTVIEGIDSCLHVEGQTGVDSKTGGRRDLPRLADGPNRRSSARRRWRFVTGKTIVCRNVISRACPHCRSAGRGRKSCDLLRRFRPPTCAAGAVAEPGPSHPQHLQAPTPSAHPRLARHSIRSVETLSSIR